MHASKFYCCADRPPFVLDFLFSKEGMFLYIPALRSYLRDSGYVAAEARTAIVVHFIDKKRWESFSVSLKSEPDGSCLITGTKMRRWDILYFAVSSIKVDAQKM